MITKTSIMSDVNTPAKYFLLDVIKNGVLLAIEVKHYMTLGDNSLVLGLVCGLLYTSASPSVVSIIVLNGNGRGIAGSDGSCSLTKCKY